MKDLIIARIKEMDSLYGGFNKQTMRWKNFEHNGKHISEVDFHSLPEPELLGLFERIVRRFYTQM